MFEGHAVQFSAIEMIGGWRAPLDNTRTWKSTVADAEQRKYEIEKSIFSWTEIPIVSARLAG